MKDKEKTVLINGLPVIIVKGTVCFPESSLDFDIIGDLSRNAVKYAENHHTQVAIVAEIDNFSMDDISENEKVEGKDNPEDYVGFYDVGVVADIVQHMKSKNGSDRVFVNCQERVRLLNYKQTGNSRRGFIQGETEKYDFEAEEDDEIINASLEDVKAVFVEWASLEGVSKDFAVDVVNKKDVFAIISQIMYSGVFTVEEQQQMIEIPKISGILEKMISLLLLAVRKTKLKITVLKRAEANIDADARENFIKEQINILNSQISSRPESGESDSDEYYTEEIEKIVNSGVLSDFYAEQLVRELNKLTNYPPMSQEAEILKTYLDTVIAVPWNKKGKLTEDFETSETILKNEHYGLEKVKERITETISVQLMTGKTGSNIICLAGPPGTGKTSIAKSIARATGRSFVRISLGGIRDEADIRGHRRTYLGSMPGRIVKALMEAGTNNPLILLDEIDKMASDMRGDPASALLEVLDSEQNKSFKDHYLEIPFDLSDVMFVATANDMSTVSAPLADRMEIIEIPSYTREEKFHIAKEHLVPKQLAEHGLSKTKLKINDDSIYYVIDNYTKEAGVRGLERKIAAICRKADKAFISENKKSMTISPKKVERMLGAKKYTEDIYMEKDSVGIVNGLAWTAVGGVLLPVEAAVMKGKGRIQLTGSLGDVMQESAKIAISYARTQSEKYGYDGDFVENSDIHIHAPEGAVPKDGPSAGVTMTTALISALSGKKVRKDVAMTGEITLHGNVLPIGGLREKTMAAYKAGMKTVIVPFKNKSDMEEVDNTVKDNVEFVFAKTLDDVLSTALK